MVGEIDIRGLPEVERYLRGAGKAVSRLATVGLERCGRLVMRTAKEYAPRSPTKAEFSATLKRKKVTDRKDFFPGGLEKSIEYAVHFGQCFIFVRDNSYAGKYARKIHDEKGKSWRNRGPGTIAKGNHADEKFIERAMNDNAANIDAILKDEFRKGLEEADRK